jgi:cytochrome c551/c552
VKTFARQAAALASLCVAALQCAGADGGDVQRGLYLSQAGGCMACHTEDKKDAVPYAGGRELKTPFGKFYGPNITPDP